MLKHYALRVRKRERLSSRAASTSLVQRELNFILCAVVAPILSGFQLWFCSVYNVTDLKYLLEKRITKNDITIVKS